MYNDKGEVVSTVRRVLYIRKKPKCRPIETDSDSMEEVSAEVQSEAV